MDHPRHDLLAGAGRSEHEDRDVRLGGRPDLLEDDQHLFVLADHLAEALHGRRPVLAADGNRLRQELVEQATCDAVAGLGGLVAETGPWRPSGHVERDELPHTVLDILLQPAEALHQHLDVKRLVGSGVQEADQAGTQG